MVETTEKTGEKKLSIAPTKTLTLKPRGGALSRATSARIDGPEAFEALAACKEPIARWAGEQGSMYHI